MVDPRPAGRGPGAAAAPDAAARDRALAAADGGGPRREPLATTPSHISDAIRQRLDAAHHSLERAAAQWSELQEKSRRDWKEFREHLADARRQRREAVRMLGTTPERSLEPG